MSNINTNGINVNYPVPGVNNNSQGFRDNFASIATNLDSAATEITDLQNKVVVKQALTGTTLNNDMANTLISNASTRSFRATTYNLGNALAGTVLVDVSLADVHYGTVAGNTTVNFGSWAPTGTQSNVQVNLAISNNLSTITFSGNIVLANANTNGASTLENFANVGGLVTVTVPNGVSQLNYLISTTDCGNTLYISPINRPRVATAIQNRSPIPTGFQGDVLGDVATDADYMYVCTGSYDASIVTKTLVVQTYASGNLINCTSTSGLFVNAPVIFSGTGFGNIVTGATYYIKTIPDGANITISATGFDGIIGNAVALTNATGTMSANSYNGTSIWQRINLAVATGTDTTTGNLTVTNNANIGNNLTVVGNTTSGNFIGTFANGTSNINIPAVNGNINVVVAGTTRLVLSGGGANITGTANVSSALTAGGNIATYGTNGVVQANNITVTGAASGNANVITVTGSMGLRAITSTYTDSAAAASSTVDIGAIHAIGAPVLAASNASVTFTNASTFLIGGAPSAGANVTITTPYSLYVKTGKSYFGGTGNFTGNVTISSSGSQSLTISAQVAGIAQIKLSSNSTGGPDSYITSTLATGGLHLQTNSTTGLFINSSQNVGIGTSSPVYKLDVTGSTHTTGSFILDNDQALFWGAGDGSVNITGNSSTDVMTFTTVGAERVRIDSSGNFLVAANAQYGSEKLNVTQSAAAAGILVRLSSGPYNNSSYAMVQGIDGTVVRFYFPSNGGLYNYSANNINLSDVRKKTDIQDAGSYLAKICAIPVRTFKYIDQTDDLLNLGCIAQEVEAVAPELVDVQGFGDEVPEDGIPLKGIYQTDLQYALMKCIQEQQALITDLTARIAALEAK